MSQPVPRLAFELSPAASRGLRILILDEHADSRTVLRLALCARGHACEATGSVLNAFALLETYKPDVVIYEWNMRCDAGVGLAAELRKRSGPAPLRVIALSTLDEPPSFRDREAVDGYLTKPFHPLLLESLLRG